MLIRNATEFDLPILAVSMARIQQAHLQAFPDIYRSFEASDAVAHLSTLIARPDAYVRVAEHEGAIAGHVVFIIEATPENMFKHQQRYGHITQIEIEPEFRRQGYGRMLLADCERIAASHDLHRITLDVWAFNDSAKSFFQSHGYRDFGSKMLRSV